MTKKDYQALARAIYAAQTTSMPAAINGEVAGAVWERRVITERIADTLQADNPRFDRARFLEACETGACRGMKRS